MCGRFVFNMSAEALARQFKLAEVSGLERCFNVAPGRPVCAVRAAAEATERKLFSPRWGLVPPWADDEAIGYRMINARAETAPDKPAFRSAFRQRRCLVPASGFFEWAPGRPRKQPWYIYPDPGAESLLGGLCFAFAALWERRERGEGVLETVTILTTAANRKLEAVHHRMPVVVPAALQAEWLDNCNEGLDPEVWAALKKPFPDTAVRLYPVSTEVNSAREDHPGLIAPAGDDPQQSLF